MLNKVLTQTLSDYQSLIKRAQKSKRKYRQMFLELLPKMIESTILQVKMAASSQRILRRATKVKLTKIMMTLERVITKKNPHQMLMDLERK